MPRPVRSLEQGRIYHVYNRVGGDGMPLSEEPLATRFVQLFRQIVKRDEMFTEIGAWHLFYSGVDQPFVGASIPCRV